MVRVLRFIDEDRDDDGADPFVVGFADDAAHRLNDVDHRALRVAPAPKFSSFAAAFPSLKVLRDPNQKYLVDGPRGETAPAFIDDLNGKFLIGHPDSMPQMKALCVKAGFSVNGDLLTFQGTTINLKSAAAVAIVDLGEGKHCAIGLGTCRMTPNLGHGFVGVVDELGRMLRGRTHFPATPDTALPI